MGRTCGEKGRCLPREPWVPGLGFQQHDGQLPGQGASTLLSVRCTTAHEGSPLPFLNSQTRGQTWEAEWPAPNAVAVKGRAEPPAKG